jgi:hypothetical protein
MAILDILSPFISAGLGLIGAAAQRKHERLMFENETARLEISNSHEMALTELSLQQRREETEQEIALNEVIGANEAFTASYASEQALSSMRWGASKLGDVANFARAITRPLITYTLTVTTILRARGHSKAVETFGLESDIAAMRLAYEQMMQNPFDLALVNMTALVIAWWFGSRGSKTEYKDAYYTRGPT